MRFRRLISVVLMTALLSPSGADAIGEVTKGTGQWTVVQVASTGGFRVPECVLADTARNQVFVANIEAEKDRYWEDDGAGFISRLDARGKVETFRWLDSTPTATLHAPKGMCVLHGKLYFTDNDQLKRCDARGPGVVETLPLPRTERLNDIATDGKHVYVSDTALDITYRVSPDGTSATMPTPSSPNGLTVYEGRLYAVSWSEHEVYELNIEGEGAPVPFDVAAHFTNLDGIEVLEDGTFVVSDFFGNKVSAIAPDRETVYTLVELETPADIGIDPVRGILYVPQFLADRVRVFKLLK